MGARRSQYSNLEFDKIPSVPEKTSESTGKGGVPWSARFFSELGLCWARGAKEDQQGPCLTAGPLAHRSDISEVG